ncbi:MAG: LysM peptidoglycan-binding domain-containing protein [Clostridia bacterium]|nr:LysM peptidoglycan-binding domain-containing protein [Clostridia bacterium]
MINNVILNDLSYIKKCFLYRVEVCDSLKAIADKFHTTQRVIAVLNGLDGEVRAGEYILVERVDGEEYIVKPTDTLEMIAQNNIEKIQEIKRKNRIDYIYVGQKIFI